MTVLITGGGGFIGAWTARRFLARGDACRIFELRDNRAVFTSIVGEDGAVDWRVGDIADTDAVIRAAEGCDAIVHLAALLTPECKADPIRGAQVNLIGTLNAFLAAREHGLKQIVYMSSAGVFGPEQGHTPAPITHYGAFKAAIEHNARAFWHDDGVASVGLRPYVVYGPGRKTGATAGPTLACAAAAKGSPYTIAFNCDFDAIFVDDVAGAIETVAAGEISGARAVNLLGHPTSTAEMIAAIRAQLPDARIDAAGAHRPVIARIEGPNMRDLFPDWTARPVRQGIAETIEYYRNS